MKLEDFDFDLPEKLIAKEPNKAGSRLLVYDSGKILDQRFDDLINYFSAGDCLIRNNSKVIPARLFVNNLNNRQIEILLTNKLAPLRYQVIAKPAKKLKDQNKYFFDDKYFVLVHKTNHQIEIELSHPEILDKFGQMPIPPYFHRQANEDDKINYQTIYAKDDKAGFSIAAPTAGLHFKEDTFQKLINKGVQILDLTLHVGLGTFAPIRSSSIDEHVMHSEYYSIDAHNWERILQAKKNSNKIFALGSTTTRTLETIYRNRELSGLTDIFIKPGFEFKVVDAMITNFHLPRSSLILLVSAFAGTDQIKKIYQHAINQEYRFYSYGDASLLIPIKNDS